MQCCRLNLVMGLWSKSPRHHPAEELCQQTSKEGPCPSVFPIKGWTEEKPRGPFLLTDPDWLFTSCDSSGNNQKFHKATPHRLIKDYYNKARLQWCLSRVHTRIMFLSRRPEKTLLSLMEEVQLSILVSHPISPCTRPRCGSLQWGDSNILEAPVVPTATVPQAPLATGLSAACAPAVPFVDSSE